MHSINHSSVEFEYSHIYMNLHIPMFAKVSEFVIPPFIGCVKCVCLKIGYTVYAFIYTLWKIYLLTLKMTNL
jgi:hypothetical protein